MFTNMYQNFGMNFEVSTQPEIETYKGVSIDAATFGIQVTDPNTPQSKMLEAMYGGGIDYRWAVVDGGYCVYAAGGAVENAIHQLIDDVKDRRCQTRQSRGAICPGDDSQCPAERFLPGPSML